FAPGIPAVPGRFFPGGTRSNASWSARDIIVFPVPVAPVMSPCPPMNSERGASKGSHHSVSPNITFGPGAARSSARSALAFRRDAVACSRARSRRYKEVLRRSDPPNMRSRTHLVMRLSGLSPLVGALRCPRHERFAFAAGRALGRRLARFPVLANGVGSDARCGDDQGSRWGVHFTERLNNKRQRKEGYRRGDAENLERFRSRCVIHQVDESHNDAPDSEQALECVEKGVHLRRSRQARAIVMPRMKSVAAIAEFFSTSRPRSGLNIMTSPANMIVNVRSPMKRPTRPWASAASIAVISPPPRHGRACPQIAAARS